MQAHNMMTMSDETTNADQPLVEIHKDRIEHQGREVANFGIDPYLLTRNTDGSKAYLLCLFNGKDHCNVVFTASDLQNRASFHRKALSNGNYFFSGNDAEYTDLCKVLLNEATPTTEVTAGGYDLDRQVTLLRNGVLRANGEFMSFNEMGMAVILGDGPDQGFYYHAGADQYRPERHFDQGAYHDPTPSFTETDQPLSQSIALIGAAHGSAGRALFAYAVLTLFSDVVLRTTGFVPVLCIQGRTCTGKSSLGSLLLTLFGMGRLARLSHFSERPISLGRALAHGANLPVVADEWVWNRDAESQELVAMAFDRQVVPRSKSSNTYTLAMSNSLCVLTYDAPPNDRMWTRSIQVRLTRSQFPPDQRKAYDALHAERLLPAGAVYQLARMRGDFERQFRELYDQELIDLGRWSAGAHPRTLRTYASLLAVITWLEGIGLPLSPEGKEHFLSDYLERAMLGTVEPE